MNNREIYSISILKILTTKCK